MENPLSFVFFVAAACLLSSCANVASKEPLGDAPAKLDTEEWNGTWITPQKTVLHVMVKDPEKGILTVAYVDSDQKTKGFKLKSHEVQVRSSGNWLWGNSKDPETGAWLFCRMQMNEHQMACWMPDRELCESWVSAGKLKGDLEMKKNVAPGTLILDLPSDTVKAITSGSLPGFLTMEHPFVFARLNSE